jgi:predicted nucleic acid-binding protein
MSSATLTSPPDATEKLVVDTDVASLVFKCHPEFAARYVRNESTRKGRQMSSADKWIAATAQVLSARLATNV